MKRLHIHIKTNDLAQSVRFYEAMFGAPPTQQEDDYAKWLLEDPRAHVSLSTHCGEPGVDHAGISIESESELEAIAARLAAIGAPHMQEAETTCCYAQSNKYWTSDPQGATWELFQTYGASETYGAEPDRSAKPSLECCNGGPS